MLSRVAEMLFKSTCEIMLEVVEVHRRLPDGAGVIEQEYPPEEDFSTRTMASTITAA